jgi:hypothetical protein
MPAPSGMLIDISLPFCHCCFEYLVSIKVLACPLVLEL